MTLTKAMIVDAIHEQLGGFGKFCVKDKNERRGRNPATGADMILDRRRVVTFRCSHLLRDKINNLF
jgi:integration host factor subunit alpha